MTLITFANERKKWNGKKNNWKFKAFSVKSEPKSLLLSKSTETVYYNQSIHRITVSSQKHTHTHTFTCSHMYAHSWTTKCNKTPSNIDTTYAFVCSHSHVRTNLIFTLLKFQQTKKRANERTSSSKRVYTFGVKIVRVEQMMNRLGVNWFFHAIFQFFHQ